MPGARDEVRATLAEQHDHVKDLIDVVMSGHADGRGQAFDEFRVFLAAHEAAEAECLHPVGKLELADTDVIEDRLTEEDEATEAMADLEQIGVDHDEFLARFDELSKEIVEHAEAEEHEELPRLLEAADDDEVDDILEALGRVPTIAPLHTSGAGVSFKELLETAKQTFAALSDKER